MTTDPWIIASVTYPKHCDGDDDDNSYDYSEWRLESPQGTGYKNKKDAIKKAIKIRTSADLFMNWEDDDDEDWSLSRDTWSTWDMAEENYDDDKSQVILVMKRSEYNVKKHLH